MKTDKQQDYSNKDWINITEPDELRYWSKILSVSSTELVNAVNEIGRQVSDVKYYLKRKQG